MGSPFLGRAGEQRLVADLVTLPAHRGSLTVLEGPAGIGKSRLLQEALAECTAAGQTVSFGRCRETSGLGLWHDQIIPGLIGARQADADHEVPSPENVLAAMRRTITGHNVVLGIDDLQEASEESIHILANLLSEFATTSDLSTPGDLRVIATLRKASTAEPPSQLLRGKNVTRLVLQGLDTTAGAEFLMACGAPYEKQHLFEHTVELVDGNPLALEAIAMQLATYQKVDRQALSALTLSTTASTTVGAALDQLGSDAATVLAGLALCDDATVRELESLDISSRPILAVLQDLEDRRIVSVTRGAVSFSHPSFGHELSRIGVRSILSGQRLWAVDKLLGRETQSSTDLVRAARILLDVAEELTPDQLNVIARARTTCIDQHDWLTALEFSHALDDFDDPDRNFEDGLAHFHLGDAASAAQQFNLARDQYETRANMDGVILASLALQRSSDQFQPVGAAIDNQALAALLAGPTSNARPELIAEVHSDLAFGSWLSGNGEGARFHSNAALELALPASAAVPAARALSCQALMALMSCDLNEARKRLSQSIEWADRSSQRLAQIAPLLRAPSIWVGLGLLENARRACGELQIRLVSARALGIDIYLEAGLAVLAAISADVPAARSAWRRTRRSAASSGEVTVAAGAGIAVAYVAMSAGLPDVALQVGEEALAPMFGPDALRVGFGRQLACWIASEDPSRPFIEPTDAQQLPHAVDAISVLMAGTTIEVARLQSTIAEVPQALAHLQDAVQRGQVVSSGAPTLLERSIGLAHALLGDSEAAALALHGAEESAERLGFPIERARALLELLEFDLVDLAEVTTHIDTLVGLMKDHRLRGLEARLEAVSPAAAEAFRAGDLDPLSTLGWAHVLFADIVSSTENALRKGDPRYKAEAESIEIALRRSVAETGGRSLRGVTTGDGIVAEFLDVRSAIDAAVLALRRVESLPLQIRIGINSGPVAREGLEIFGTALNFGSRVSDVANPGTVFMTEWALSRLGSEAGLEIRDEGSYAFKGMEERVRAFSVSRRP